MSHFSKISHFKFLKNKEFNQFYLALFIMAFWEAMINIFVPIYLYNLGFEIHQILFFYFLVSLYFLIFSFLAAKIVSKIWDKHAIVLSSPFLIIFYIGLIFEVPNIYIFYLLPLFLSLRSVFFNYGYHLNFLNHSDQKSRGKELAFIGIIAILATIVAPYIWSVLADINFAIVFIVSSVLISIGTTPLLATKDNFEKIEFSLSWIIKKIFSKPNRWNFISFWAYAVESVIWITVWPIFLVLIAWSLQKTWLLISASMLFSLLVFHVVWKLTDKFSKIKMLKLWTILYFFAWLGRIFANTAYKVLFIDSYKNLSEKVLLLPWAAHSYDLAKRTNSFEFIVSREIIFNFIRVLIFPIIIFIFYINYHPFVISFLIAGFFCLGYIFIDE